MNRRFEISNYAGPSHHGRRPGPVTRGDALRPERRWPIRTAVDSLGKAEGWKKLGPLVAPHSSARAFLLAGFFLPGKFLTSGLQLFTRREPHDQGPGCQNGA
jgi:hypothetical protein